MSTASPILSVTSSTKSLFDQMFALPVGANKDPILPEPQQVEVEDDFIYDPMDVVLLAEAALENSDSSESSEYKDRLAECRQLISDSNTSDKPLSSESLKTIQRLKADVDKLVNHNICDDSTWNGLAPKALRLKDLPGAFDFAIIESEEMWMVRGANYLNDKKKVPYWIHCPFQCCHSWALAMHTLTFPMPRPDFRLKLSRRCSICAGCRSWSNRRVHLQSWLRT
jgi:hypothetical protein